MIAAIYARKSTEQSVADDAKSVTRQLDRAAAYARAKGWSVDERFVFTDDGISGAEFAARPGFLRLMAAVGKGSSPFNVLIMAEESRLGRESIETAYALKRLITGGVRVFFYLDDRERTLDSPTEKILLSLTAYADELERDRARQRTHDALARKAAAGHVTGGRVFGYDNRVVSVAGRRSHVERVINADEAAVVTRIFTRCAQGWGYTRIAKTLNADAAPCPVPGRGWSPTSIMAVLDRDLYRGRIVWNKTRKRNAWGQKAQAARPPSDWLTLDAPSLRIIDDDSWEAAQRARQARRSIWTGLKPTTTEPKYLLSGLLRCGVCGGSVHGSWRGGGHESRWYGYVCGSYHKRGATVCANNAITPVTRLDVAVMNALLEDILDDDAIDVWVAAVLDALDRRAAHDATPAIEARLSVLSRELSRLVAALATGDPSETVLTAIRERERERGRLTTSLAVSTRSSAAARLQAAERTRFVLREWRSLVTTDPTRFRALLDDALLGPIVVRPMPGTGTRRGIEFAGDVHLLGPLRGFVLTDDEEGGSDVQQGWRPHRDLDQVARRAFAGVVTGSRPARRTPHATPGT